MTVVRPRIANKFAIPEFNEEEFSQFSEIVFSSGLQTADAFMDWDIRVRDVHMTLMVDPSLNLPGFWAQLQEVQEKKNALVEIMMSALVQKGDWEGFVSSAERYSRQVRAKLVQDATVKADVFDVQHYCESTLVLVKTMLSAFDKKLDLLESANLNINRQITVAELLTYRGLL
jgi:hypothetical protein